MEGTFKGENAFTSWSMKLRDMQGFLIRLSAAVCPTDMVEPGGGESEDLVGEVVKRLGTELLRVGGVSYDIIIISVVEIPLHRVWSEACRE